MLFTLTIHDSAGQEIIRKSGLSETDAHKLAQDRPPLGSTAITRDDIQVPHKAVRLTVRRVSGYCATSTRRPSNAQIEMYARGFAADGEYGNAAAMLELRK